MLRSLESVIGYDIQATDDLIGKVKDFLFDDQAWVIRYMVADTGRWLPGRKVLIIPAALDQPSWENYALPVKLTRQQVEESPDISEDMPVSEQNEIDLHRHYSWDPYWLAHTGQVGPMAFPPAAPPESDSQTIPPVGSRGDPHLRSAKEVAGYHVAATDGDIGHIEDFILDGEEWIIRYVVVDTRNWLPGKKVLVSPEWFEAVSWADRKVFIDMDKDRVRNSPPYDANRPVNREDEGVLYDYHGRPAYWKTAIEKAGATVGHW